MVRRRMAARAGIACLVVAALAVPSAGVLGVVPGGGAADVRAADGVLGAGGAGSSGVVPVMPQRWADWSEVQGFGPSRCVDVAEVGAPADVSGVLVNLTSVSPPGNGNAVVFPSDGSASPVAPVASSVQFEPGQTVASAALSGVGPDGRVCVASQTYAGSSRVLMDVSAFFTADSGVVLDGSRRLLDTRQEGAGLAARSVREVQVGGRVGVPADAEAVVLSVTAVAPGGGGNLRVFPATGTSQVPGVSTVNYVPSVTKANAAVVPLGKDGKVGLYSDTGAGAVQVVLDVTGYVAAGSAAYRSVDPVRVLDTRAGAGALRVVPTLAANTPVAFDVAATGLVPEDAMSVVLNVTAIAPTSVGNLRVYPDDDGTGATAPPGASNINYIPSPGRAIPNLVMVKVPADGKIMLYSDQPGGSVDVAVDLVGYTTGTGPDDPGLTEPTEGVSYKVASGTVEAASGAVRSVSSAGGDPQLDAEGNATGTAPWSATVQLSKNATVPQVGQYYLVPPCDAAYPSGVAGQVTQVKVNGDGTTTLSLGEAALNQVFAELHVSYSGPLDQTAPACPGAGGAQPVAFMAGGLDAVSLAGAAGVLPAPGVQALAAAGPASGWLDCWSSDNGAPLEAHLVMADLTWKNPTVVFELDLMPLGIEHAEMSVTADLEVSVQADVSLKATCKVAPALTDKAKVTYPVGTTGATVSIAPEVKVGIDTAASISEQVSRTIRTTAGVEINNNVPKVVLRGEPEPQPNPDPQDVSSSVQATMWIQGGLQLQVGILDRVGVYGNAGARLSFILASVQSAENTIKKCLGGFDLSIEAALGVFVDLFVYREELEFASLTIQLLHDDGTCTNLLDPGDGGTDPGGDPGGGGTNPDSSVAFRQISTGYGGGQMGMIALSNTGEVWGWDCQAGRLAVVPGLMSRTVSKVRSANGMLLAITESGDLYTWQSCGGPLWGDLNSTPTLAQCFGGAIDAGTRHNAFFWFGAIAITAEGRIYSGFSSAPLCADHRLRTVPDSVRFIKYDDGWTHGLALSDDGHVYGWSQDGWGGPGNEYGEIADADNLFRATDPKPVSGLTDVVDISAGTYISLAVTADGQVYAWGEGANGILGEGAAPDARSPQLVPGLTDVVSVAAIERTGFAVTAAGDLYAWGLNDFSAAGAGDRIARPTRVPEISGVVSVVGGYYHRFALTDTGELWGWGSGTNLGLPHDPNAPMVHTPIRVSYATGQ